MSNIILQHTIKAVFSSKATFPLSDYKNSPTYIPDYMTKDLLKYIESLVQKEHDYAKVENEQVEWDLYPAERVNIGLVGNIRGEMGYFILSFDLPSGKPKIPSFEIAK